MALLTNHVICTALVYLDKLPNSLKGDPSQFEYQIIINYILVVAIPVNEWKITGLCMYPMFLIGVYF